MTSTSTSTFAYLDAGSAAVVLQMIGGGVVAIALTFKLFGRKILNVFRRGTHEPEAEAFSSPDTP